MCDSQRAIHLSKNQAYHDRTKDLDVRYHFIIEVLERKEIDLIKVLGEEWEEHVAYMFTKAVSLCQNYTIV